MWLFALCGRGSNFFFASGHLEVSDFCLLLHRLKLIAARPVSRFYIVDYVHTDLLLVLDHEEYVRPEFPRGFGHRKFISVVFGLGFDLAE